jgi:hypothetical protein
MKNYIIACAVASLVSGCVTSSSNGFTTNGKPVHVQIEGGLNKQVSLDFGGPLRCSGTYSGSAVGHPKAFPLTCTDGSVGKATMVAKEIDLVVHGTLTYTIEGRAKGNIDLRLGETAESAREKRGKRAELDLRTCRQANVSGKAAVAFAMRINGVSREQARRQLGAATAGTVGFLVREAAVDAAYSPHTESSEEARHYGLLNCIQRFSDSQ